MALAKELNLPKPDATALSEANDLGKIRLFTAVIANEIKRCLDTFEEPQMRKGLDIVNRLTDAVSKNGKSVLLENAKTLLTQDPTGEKAINYLINQGDPSAVKDLLLSERNRLTSSGYASTQEATLFKAQAEKAINTLINTLNPKEAYDILNEVLTEEGITSIQFSYHRDKNFINSLALNVAKACAKSGELELAQTALERFKETRDSIKQNVAMHEVASCFEDKEVADQFRQYFSPEAKKTRIVQELANFLQS